MVNRGKQENAVYPAGMTDAAQSGDKQQQRLSAIMATLQDTGSVTVEEMAEQLAVTVVTIRRDLDVLEHRGLLRRRGVSCFDSEEAQLNSAMVRHARRHIAVVDHTKLGVVANFRICETGAVQKLITDSGATNEMIAPYQKLGIEVLRV